MSIEEQGKGFANQLTAAVEASGVYSQLNNPKDSFMSGCYFGAVQGYKRGVNQMLVDATNHLPDIFNKIAESNFNMSIDWTAEFRKLLLKECFEITE